MRTREVKMQWQEMQEGDKFLRYEQCGAVKMLIVQRQAPDLPTHKGAMGYAVVVRHGERREDVLLIRTYGSTDTHPNPWLAPYENGMFRMTNDSNIESFRPMQVVPIVSRRTMEDAIVKGSGRGAKDLDFTGVSVRGIYDAMALALYLPE